MAHERHHHGPATPEAAHNPSGLDLLSLAWRRKSLLALGAMIGLVLGGIYYSRLTPVYQASAQVLVVKKTNDALPMAGVDARFGYFEDYLATHQVLIKSPLIIKEAVEKGELQKLKSFGGRDPLWSIIGSLTIARDTKEGGASNILVLSYQGTDPNDCQVVLKAVIDAYTKFLEEKYRDVSKETEKLVKKAQEMLKKDLKDAKEKYRQFRIDNPFLVRTKDGGNLRQERLMAMESKKLYLADREAELEGRLLKYEAQRKEKRPPGELLWTLREPERRPVDEKGRPMEASSSARGDTKVTLTEQYITLLLQEQRLLMDYGPDHPEVQKVRTTIRFLRSRAKMPAFLAEEGQPALAQAVKEALAAVNEELASIRRDRAFLGERSKLELAEAQKLTKIELEEGSLRGELVSTQQLFDGVVKRLQEINLIKDQGGFQAQDIFPPTAGGRVGPRTFPIFSVALFVGLLAGLGLAYLVEITDRSFRTPDDIARRLGLPVVGCIPKLRIGQEAEITPEEQVSALDPSLYVYHRSRSREAEAYRGVRTSLLFSARRDGAKIIQITSPQMADGKSTLAANLAVAIAQSGKQVILVDADFRRPRVHKLFGVTAQKGVTSVLQGAAELTGVCQATEVSGLTVLPCGPIPPNPAELLAGSQFHELLEALGRAYDFVLVDTPPLLAVTDPSVVVPSVDGVVLTLRLSKNARPSAERAKEILENMGAKVIGVVVNEVDTGLGGYGYGSYYYGPSGYYTDEDGLSAPTPDQAVPVLEGGPPATANGGGRAEKNGHGKPRPSMFRWFFNGR